HIRAKLLTTNLY
ncbi:hypothetical protein ANME2D_00935, partial [Candidatus Methanoperedens nitroreducens]